MPPYTVRAATLDDVPHVRRLEEQWVQNGDIIALVATPVRLLERYVGGGCFLVVEQARETVGFVCAESKRNEGSMSAVVPGGQWYLDIDGLYVLPAHRSAGAGSQLLDATVGWAKRHNVRYLTAFTATREIDRVLRFYRSCGFETWGVQLFRDLGAPPAAQAATGLQRKSAGARLPLQVLVLPFRRRADGRIQYAIFRRSDFADDCWQGVAGGAEQGETAEEAAGREMSEEAGIPADTPLMPLDTVASVPASEFRDRDLWGPDLYVVTQRAFGVRLHDAQAIILSREHTEHRWVPYEEAARLLRWDSDRTALWELNERLARGAANAADWIRLPTLNRGSAAANATQLSARRAQVRPRARRGPLA